MPNVAFSLNTLQSLLWILRHNEFDTINLYNSLTPFSYKLQQAAMVKCSTLDTGVKIIKPLA